MFSKLSSSLRIQFFIYDGILETIIAFSCSALTFIHSFDHVIQVNLELSVAKDDFKLLILLSLPLKY